MIEPIAPIDGCWVPTTGSTETLPIPVSGIPQSLCLLPQSRWPTVLPDETVATVLNASLPLAVRKRKAKVVSFPRPLVSIIIPIRNNLVCNRLCLESLLDNTQPNNFEIVVVDNGSDDGTLEYLVSLSHLFPQVRLIGLGENHSFAHTINCGLAEARGDVFVLLNNDTILPQGWLQPLLERLNDSRVGLVGPVTNRTGNEAQIETTYSTYGELLDFAREHKARHRGKQFEIRMLAMYCVALRREVFEQIGPLDARFEVGLFEDDDYSMRVRRAGYRVVCAEDSFVHHFGQMSLGQLRRGEYGILFHENRRRWEEKWQTKWQPYERRINSAYEQLREQIRVCVDQTLPTDARVLVISKGDEELLRLNGRPAWHLPQCEDGVYAGHHPSNCREALDHLESLRVRRNGQFLLVPKTEWWWLEHYPDFRRYLEGNCPVVSGQDESCLIFSLGDLEENRPSNRTLDSVDSTRSQSKR